jgi:hypothetical protein
MIHRSPSGAVGLRVHKRQRLVELCYFAGIYSALVAHDVYEI